MVPCGSSVLIATHCVYTVHDLCMLCCYVCHVYSCADQVQLSADFQAKKEKEGGRKTALVFLPLQAPCLYITPHYTKQDTSTATEKRVVPAIAMLLQHHEPRGLAGCQAAITHRAVCLFSLPSS